MLEVHRFYPGVALVVTELGSVLLGVPTDAFKATKHYCTNAGLPFPRILVTPNKMLINAAPQFNPEFFLYDFLFIYGAAFKPELAGQRLQLVLDEQQVLEVKRALQITLSGPSLEELQSYQDNHGNQIVDNATATFLSNVAMHMAIQKDGKPRSLDDMLDIRTFDRKGTVNLLNGELTLERKSENNFTVKRGRKSEHVDLSVRSRVIPYATLPIPSTVQRPLKFGVKPLGTRSGFDLSGPSTGFIIWVDGKACIYDGPVGTRYLLESQGIACDDISMIVLSHCHEDHMGAFVELVLSGHRPKVFTTEPIYRSALIKLSSYFRMSQERVAEYIDYHRVTPGEPFDALGATFELFYTVHAIPAVGIKVRYLGSGNRQQLVISGDTLHHEGLLELQQKGIITRDKCTEMLELVPRSKNNGALFFCDVGESIIHGHPSDWSDNPNQVLYYHCPDNAHTRSFGRELATPGKAIELIENAPMIRSAPPRLMVALSFLDITDPQWLNRFLEHSQTIEYTTNEILVRAGDPISQFLCVVVNGLLEADGHTSDTPITIRPGEFYGFLEHVDPQGKSTATIRALCPSELIEVPTSILTEYIDYFGLSELLPFIEAIRPLVDATPLFRDLKIGERNLLSRQASQESYAQGAVIVPQGSSDNFFYLLVDGAVSVYKEEKKITDIYSKTNSSYFGISAALKPGQPRTTSIRAASNVKLVRLPAQTIRSLFDEEMGIHYELTRTLDSRLVALSK